MYPITSEFILLVSATSLALNPIFYHVVKTMISTYFGYGFIHKLVETYTHSKVFGINTNSTKLSQKCDGYIKKLCMSEK